MRYTGVGRFGLGVFQLRVGIRAEMSGKLECSLRAGAQVLRLSVVGDHEHGLLS